MLGHLPAVPLRLHFLGRLPLQGKARHLVAVTRKTSLHRLLYSAAAPKRRTNRMTPQPPDKQALADLLGRNLVAVVVICLEIPLRLLVRLEAVLFLAISLLLLLVLHRRGAQLDRDNRFSDRRARSQAPPSSGA